MAEQPRRLGCVKTLVLFAVVIGAVVGGALGWISWRMGGISGFQREVLVKGAVIGVEQQVLAQRPDGISEDEVKAEFSRLRDAVSQDRVDKGLLYHALRDYQRAFKNTNRKPSDGELRSFLSSLDQAILSVDPTPVQRGGL
ncbi:hypothetical protein FJZ36_05215 [Candidatus Poribacteria bacterium]|nr:hypothetical protein [Candidatus Poribacteria bacterium]